MQPELRVNVLLVDDHPENLLALEAILDKPGHNLVKANSGPEALRCLLSQDFAVILLDVQMPGMDGFETATLIRNRQRSQHTPIIFLTAFSKSDSLRFKGYSLGAVDYLYKPVEPEILASKVGVFVDLFKKTAEVKRQAQQLAAINVELRASEERFRSLSASSPIGIFLTDVEGRCTYTNPRFQVICGSSFEQSLGDGWLQSVYPEDRVRLMTDWSAWTLANREYFTEFRLRTPDGIDRQVQMRTSPMFSAQGELLGHVGTVEDITDRKQAEEARAQVIREQAAREEAEAANRMKDEFLATLSHELRTPLNSVLGWAGLLRTRKFDEATFNRALEIIERNAKSQAQLIEDILDVSRLIRGKLELNLCPIGLVRAIEAAIDAVRPTAESKRLELETQLEESDDQVCGDPNRLQQVVWNLLSNAIKFTPEGGRVVVRLKHMNSHARIQIIDTGIGISADFLPYVFDRFRQQDSTTTRSYGGLGLGLAIVRHLVELHGGRVQAQSEGEDKGATFTVDLPLQNQTEPEPSCSEPPELQQQCDRFGAERSTQAISNLSDLQVLLVDDEPDVRELLTTLLEEHGATVTAVSSAPDALKAFKQSPPDILVSDIAMPFEDGYTLIRKIRELEAESNQREPVPAVALTAYAREEDCKNAIASGFQIHMSKPVNTAQFVMEVANLTGRTLTENQSAASF